MITISEKVKYSKLLQLYKNMLNDKQNGILEDYYDFDLSLNEIAINRGVSKNAVHDLIKRVTKTLDSYEKALNLLEIHNKLNEIREKYEQLSKEEIKELLDKVNEYGI